MLGLSCSKRKQQGTAGFVFVFAFANIFLDVFLEAYGHMGKDFRVFCQAMKRRREHLG